MSPTRKLSRRAAGAVLALLGALVPAVTMRPSPAVADTGQVDSAVIGTREGFVRPLMNLFRRRD